MDDAQEQATGTLYRIDPDLGCTAIDNSYKITNGPAFSPDGRTMYHNDSALQVTYAYDLEADGSAGNRREFARYGGADGHPDGMTVDSEGCLWIAFWGGWCVRRFSPQGECIATIDVPVEQPSSCTFGGENLDRLYITSASIGLDEEVLAMQPNAGGLFMTIPGVRGLAERAFGG
jgi:sugar lactone lactonase YvrE